MNRKESNLGEQQAEGNLGNERNRNSGGSRRGENVKDRPGEGSMRERSRVSEDRESSEDWSPSSDVHDNNDARRGGSER